MPIYEYVCQSCGSEFEVMQKFDDPNPKSHDCSPKSKVKRKLSLTSFQLSGGGWYSQGYAKKGSGGGSESSAPSTAPEKTSTASAPAHGCGGACACN